MRLVSIESTLLLFVLIQNFFDATDLYLPAGTKLHINGSLCPCYRGLWNETKKLWNKKKVFSYFTLSVAVKIRLQEKGSYSIITHIAYVKELFPDEDFSDITNRLIHVQSWKLRRWSNLLR